MKKMLARARETMREYWARANHSKNVNMSRGAQFVNKIITFAHGDNWRRHNDKKDSHKK